MSKLKRANENDRSTPVFTHDCTNCFFLGTVHTKDQSYGGTWDLWWCPRPLLPSGTNDSSVICRYGNEGHEYSASMTPECAAEPLQFIEMMKLHEWPYIFNMARAVKAGLYNGPWKGHFRDAG
jgi:hypothetical protein